MEDDQLKLFSKIKRCDWRFHRPDWRHISDDAKDLVRALLVLDPAERMTVDEALRCPWITQDGNDLSSIDLQGSISNIMLKRQRLRSVAQSVIFMGKMGVKLANGNGSSENAIPEVENEDGNKMDVDEQ
jgi:serine/threonine protein kinase